MLVLRRGQVVSVDTAIDALWPRGQAARPCGGAAEPPLPPATGLAGRGDRTGGRRLPPRSSAIDVDVDRLVAARSLPVTEPEIDAAARAMAWSGVPGARRPRRGGRRGGATRGAPHACDRGARAAPARHRRHGRSRRRVGCARRPTPIARAPPPAADGGAGRNRTQRRGTARVRRLPPGARRAARDRAVTLTRSATCRPARGQRACRLEPRQPVAGAGDLARRPRRARRPGRGRRRPAPARHAGWPGRRRQDPRARSTPGIACAPTSCDRS